MSEKKLYAVVQFSVDESFSEIPTNWIYRNDENDSQICWWPNTKNISSLIENRTEPDMKLWSIFDITVIKYYSSLTSARKSAADAHYATTDDEKCGRRQKKLKKNEYFCFEEHDEKDCADDSNDEGGNVCDKENYDNEKNKSIKHLKQSIDRPVFISMPQYNFQKTDNFCQSVDPLATSSTDKNQNLFVFKNPDEISSSRTNINKCSSNERAIEETPDKSSSSVTMDIENIPILEVPEVQDVYNILQRIETGLDKVIRTNVTINFELMSISKRLSKLESRQRNNTELTENDMVMILPLLPLQTVESIKEFENLIISNEVAASQFKKMILKVGGNTPRNSIHRALERIITNKCAMSCSWKGVRSNYKICNLTFIKNIRDTICSVHSGLTEAEFDITTAEWFRFAKQRAAREEKRNDL
ncbi:hypothetical protein ACS0PU_002710 [Formica fusca]